MRWILGVLVALGACDCGSGGGDGTDGGLGDECASSRNCPFGFVCVDGRCEPASGRDAGVDGGGLDAGHPGPDASSADGGGPDGGLADSGVRDARRPDGGGIEESVFQYGVMRGSEVRVFDVLVNELPARDDVPVFLYLPAAGEPYDSPVARAWLRAMAELGYFAASAAYDDSPVSSCAQLDAKAREIFAGSGGISGGLLFDLCSMVGSVCDRGVALVGHDQGGQIAMLAQNHDARIRAVLATGVGYVMNRGSVNLGSCLVDSRALSSDALRLVNGASDTLYGPFTDLGLTPTLREQMDALSGRSCGAPIEECLRPNGSGWILVADRQVADGNADHCYHSVAGCGSEPDPNWASTAGAWGLAAGRDWLHSLTPF